MRILFSLLVFSLSFTIVQSQSEWTLVKELPVQGAKTYIDQLNNLYVIKKGEIRKLDPDGNEICRYSNKLIGENVLLDVTNPMKVILYAPDQMKLTFLDSRLGEMNEKMDFFRMGFEQVTLAATSFGNGVWVYDPIKFQLIRYNQNLEEDYRSLNLAQLFRVEFFPTHLIEVNQKVFLTDPNHGVFVFDIYGNYLRKIPIKGINKPVVVSGLMFYNKGESIYVFDLDLNAEDQLKLTLPENGSFDANSYRLCINDKNSLKIWQRNEQEKRK